MTKETTATTLIRQADLLRKWAKNLAPAAEYLSPAALAKELVRMADTLELCADELQGMQT